MKNIPLLLVFVSSTAFAQLDWSVLPTITSFAPTSGPVGTLITINGTNLQNTSYVAVGTGGAVIVSKTSTRINALVMPGTTSGSICVSGPAPGFESFTYCDLSFTVTSTPFPSAQQGNKLVGTGGLGTPGQGYSVALSAEGNTAIVGGPFDNGGSGAAWVYIRNSFGSWTQQGSKLVGTGAVGNANRGYSVALSADGNTAIIGGKDDNGGIGAAWVFTRSSSGVWAQQGSKLVGTGAVGSAGQGSSVALSADGNTALIGGYVDNSNSFEVAIGAAWVFTRSNSIWTQQGSKLVGTGAVGFANQGTSVALSADGKTALIGGPGDNSGVGAAWVFTRSSSGVWAQQGSKLVGTGAVGTTPLQGVSVALSANGNTALIGGIGDNSAIGATWVFTRSGSTWTQQGSKLVGTGTVGSAYQGHSVALSADGNTALIGGLSDNSNAGATWVFTRSGSTWTQQGSKLVGNGAVGASGQGRSVALSANGNTALIGGITDSAPVAGGTGVGAAWVFVRCSTPTAYSVTGGGTYCSGGGGVAVGLAGSQTGVSYQLRRNAVNIGSPVAGTGSAISFGNQTLVGTYTVSAQSGTCNATMTGSKTVAILICRLDAEGNEIEVTEEQELTSSLSQNIPNPTNESTLIPCFIQSDSKTAHIVIYGVDGKMITQLPINGKGKQQVAFQRNGLAAGIYFYALLVDGQQIAIKKMVLAD